MKTRLFVAFGAVVGSGLFSALPATAQSQAVSQQRTKEIIVFGTDPCPRSTDDEVVVCARRPEKERYRLPEALRPTGPPQLSQSWSVRSKALATMGQTGPGTCSGVGPGGDFGCATKEIQKGVAERAEQDAQDSPPE
ncbi:hypothetical protein [Sphingomonas glaciei]|uniref:Secreted protein n=1 Tax=Sphingomonas glaciei TaxID=2938948 RepID=A0ABY5MT47_9SPHN|nr:hypothetical protein [Sphingomonas glaciei]UUR07659.1 hypothetical protein M1K48_12095 [Sphingomonas glaciei]